MNGWMFSISYMSVSMTDEINHEQDEKSGLYDVIPAIDGN